MGMVLIQAQTLSSSAASVTFSSIPQTYKTLRLVVSARTSAASVHGPLYASFNGVTTNLSSRRLEGNGASAASYQGFNGSIEFNLQGNSATANTFGSFVIDLPNYAGSAAKAVSLDSVSENNATTAYQNLVAGLWNSTAAITSITIQNGTDMLLAGSSFYLYGIK